MPQQHTPLTSEELEQMVLTNDWEQEMYGFTPNPLVLSFTTYSHYRETVQDFRKKYGVLVPALEHHGYRAKFPTGLEFILSCHPSLVTEEDLTQHPA